MTAALIGADILDLLLVRQHSWHTMFVHALHLSDPY
jgi:hypothetical protein